MPLSSSDLREHLARRPLPSPRKHRAFPTSPAAAECRIHRLQQLIDGDLAIAVVIK